MNDNGMVGANLEQLRILAGEFERAANEIDGELRAATSSVRNTPWQGATADRFRQTWTSVHSTRLRALSTQLRDSARILRDNADDQQQVSNAGAGAGSAGGGADGLVPFLVGLADGSKRFSDEWGWLALPMIGWIPVVGKAASLAGDLDKAIRLGQDYGARNFQGVYEKGSDLIADGMVVGAKKYPPLLLAAADVEIYKHVEIAARQINWSDVVHHPEQLNPLAPGAFSAVMQSEKEGLTNLGKDLFGLVAGVAR